MNTVTFEVNMDEKCKQCGKKGAVNGNICLDCLLKNMKAGKYDDQFKKARQRIKEKSKE